MTRTLIKNGSVVTLDEKLGDIPGGDILIEGDKIAAVGHGTAKPMHQPQDAKPYYEIPQPREEVRRLRTGRLASDDRLVTMALAILGPDWGTYEVAEADIRLARDAAP